MLFIFNIQPACIFSERPQEDYYQIEETTHINNDKQLTEQAVILNMTRIRQCSGEKWPGKTLAKDGFKVCSLAC